MRVDSRMNKYNPRNPIEEPCRRELRIKGLYTVYDGHQLYMMVIRKCQSSVIGI